MPISRRQFKKRQGYRKRRRYNNRKAGQSKALICRTLGGFPDKYFAKFKCTYSYSSTFAASAFQRTYFKLNSPLAPISSQACSGLGSLIGNVSTAGTNVPPYVNGLVRACRIVVGNTTEVSSTANISPIITICPLPVNQTTYTGNAYALSESPHAKSRFLNSNVSANSMGLSKDNRIVCFWNMHDIYGINRKSDLRMLENNVFNYVTDPTNLYYGVIGMVTDAGANTDATLAIAVTVELTYWVELFNRNNALLSAPS